MFWIKSGFFDDLDQTWSFHQFFSKILSKTEIFKNYDQNRGISKIFTKIKILKGFDQNLDDKIFWPK